MQFTNTFLATSFLAFISTVSGASVNFYNSKDATCGGSPSLEYRNLGCNTCVDPPAVHNSPFVWLTGGVLKSSTSAVISVSACTTRQMYTCIAGRPVVWKYGPALSFGSFLLPEAG
ncbi:hypothetical protein BDQ17DRAFT_1324415 [Cyathus striatus]|nr:hypothetical protein BDQ17DRAFT_1324415 [Cyathus striatus]